VTYLLVLFPSFSKFGSPSLQCCNTVGLSTGRAIPACKKSGVGLLVATIWLEHCTTYSSRSLASIKLANPGSLGKMAVKMDRVNLDRSKYFLPDFTIKYRVFDKPVTQNKSYMITE